MTKKIFYTKSKDIIWVIAFYGLWIEVLFSGPFVYPRPSYFFSFSFSFFSFYSFSLLEEADKREEKKEREREREKEGPGHEVRRND